MQLQGAPGERVAVLSPSIDVAVSTVATLGPTAPAGPVRARSAGRSRVTVVVPPAVVLPAQAVAKAVNE